MCTSHSSLSFAILGCPSQWLLSSALVMCTSHLHLSISPLAFAPHILLIASLIAPLTCTSDLHLLQHLSIASLSCTYHVGHAASHLGCTSRLHFSVSSLIWTSQFLLLIAPLGCGCHICTSSAPLHPSDAFLNLIFEAKRYQAGSLVPLAWLPQLCLKILVEPRGRSCAQRSCEPET